MNAMDRLWSIGAAIVAIAVLAGAWFGTVSPDLDAASSADSTRENVEMQNSIHQTRLVALEEAASRIGELQAERDGLAEGIPADVEYSAFLRQLQQLASQSGVTLVSVTTDEALIYGSPVESTEPPADTGASDDGAADDGDTATAATDGADGADAVAGESGQVAPVPYADPLITADNFAAIPVGITAEGEVAALLEFQRLVQTGVRLVSISTVSVVDPTEAEPGRLDTSGYLYALHG